MMSYVELFMKWQCEGVLQQGRKLKKAGPADEARVQAGQPGAGQWTTGDAGFDVVGTN